MIAALLCALLLAADGPMTDEEVVRRVLAGEGVDAILAEVRTRPAAFDVSEDMLLEMRRAGVPEALLAAMAARAQTAAPEPEPEQPPAPAARLRLRPEDPVLVVSRNLGPQRVAELELPAGALEVDAAALAVLCVTEDGLHPREASLRWPEGIVPKELRKSRLLVFLPAVESGRSGKQLRVALGAEVDVPLEADTSHDLLIAVVARAGGRWVMLDGDELHGVRAAAGTPATADLVVEKDPDTLARVKVRRPVDDTLPELPRSGGWAKDGSLATPATGPRAVSLSPDGRKRLLLGPEGATLSIEGRAAAGLHLPAAPETEILWSPDSRVVALTRATPAGSAVDVFRIEVDDAVRALPLPEGLPAEVAAVAFPEKGTRLLLVGRQEGHLAGFLLRTSDGSLAARYTELEVRARWGERLGRKLR